MPFSIHIAEVQGIQGVSPMLISIASVQQHGGVQSVECAQECRTSARMERRAPQVRGVWQNQRLPRRQTCRIRQNERRGISEGVGRATEPPRRLSGKKCGAQCMEHCGTECAAGPALVRCEVRREVQGMKNGPRQVTARPVCVRFTRPRTGPGSPACGPCPPDCP